MGYQEKHGRIHSLDHHPPAAAIFSVRADFHGQVGLDDLAVGEEMIVRVHGEEFAAAGQGLIMKTNLHKW